MKAHRQSLVMNRDLVGKGAHRLWPPEQPLQDVAMVVTILIWRVSINSPAAHALFQRR
jgi:hypothetical protein